MPLPLDEAYRQIKNFEESGQIPLPEPQQTVIVGTVDASGAFRFKLVIKARHGPKFTLRPVEATSAVATMSGIAQIVRKEDREPMPLPNPTPRLLASPNGGSRLQKRLAE